MSSVVIAGNTSGSITISAPDVSGSNTLTLPVATDTLVGKATTDTLTNKTLVNPTITGNLTTTGNTILGDASTDTLNVGNGGLVKDASGNVGIGTASPNFPITIYNVSSQVQFTNSATGTTSSDGFKIGLGGGSSTDAYINLLENTNLIFNTNATERMRIDSSGNVGIGNTPAVKLDVGFYTNSASYSGGRQASSSSAFFGANGTIGGIRVLADSYDVATSAYIDLANFGSKNLNISSGYRISGGVAANAGISNQYLSFSSIKLDTGGTTITATEQMRIDASGNMFLGKTADSSSVQGLSFFPSGSTQSANNGSGTVIHYEFYRSGTRVGRIETTTSATSYVTSSDYRLKEEIAPMTGALDKVAQLKPVTYKWKVDGANGQGFIAHELQEVIPDCVSGQKDAVNEDGSIDPQGIDTSFLVATLTAAIQEQQVLITQLQADVATLKALSA